MRLPTLAARSCQGHSPHCTFTASHGHTHVHRHTHTHTHAHWHMCAQTEGTYTDTHPHTCSTYTCALTRTGEHGHAQLYTHSCPTYAGTPVHPHTHTCAHSTYTCACTCTCMGIHTCTLTEVLARVCTHSHVVPPPPAWGQGPGNPGRGSTAGPLAEPWPPRASARAGLPPLPSTPVTLFAIKSLMLRQEKIAPF